MIHSKIAKVPTAVLLAVIDLFMARIVSRRRCLRHFIAFLYIFAVDLTCDKLALNFVSQLDREPLSSDAWAELRSPMTRGSEKAAIWREGPAQSHTSIFLRSTLMHHWR
jgi:hypothetical protein